MRQFVYETYKHLLTENISSSQVVRGTCAKMEARCPYKTNKERGDVAAAPSGSPWAPQAYLGGQRWGEENRAK